jgi:hypothetical protein
MDFDKIIFFSLVGCGGVITVFILGFLGQRILQCRRRLSEERSIHIIPAASPIIPSGISSTPVFFPIPPILPSTSVFFPTPPILSSPTPHPTTTVSPSSSTLYQTDSPPAPTDSPKTYGACSVCMVRGAVFTCVPCGHVCICYNCKEKLDDTQKKTCPICIAVVRGYMRVYICSSRE